MNDDDNDDDEVTAHVETITPDYAKALLEQNTGSRPIKNTIVNAYAEDMRNGKWFLNGEAIKISSNNQILDGLHRVFACIASDTPFTTIVVRGLDPTAIVIITR